MDIIKELNRIKIDKHKCLGCGYENSCATKGCAIINQAIKIINEKIQFTSKYDSVCPNCGHDELVRYCYICDYMDRCSNCEFHIDGECTNPSSDSYREFTDEKFHCGKFSIQKAVDYNENCTVLGSEPIFGFDEAIKYIKRGLKLRRKAWECKEQYVQLTKNVSDILDGRVIYNYRDDINYDSISRVGMNVIKINWTPEYEDMLAEDWCFVGEENEKDKT